MSPTTCPEDPDLRLFVDGALDESAAEQLLSHVTTCAACGSAVQALENQQYAPLLNVSGTVTLPPVEDDEQLQFALWSFRESVETTLVQEADDARGLPQIEGFRWGGLVGRGGSSRVHRAWDRRLRRSVAIKLLQRQSEQDVARFEREMQTVAGLDHPHIVRAHGAGVADGVPYLVMELIEGVNLSELEQACRPVPAAAAAEAVRQAALAIAFAFQQRGLVHRDVKPANLMVGSDGVVKLLDLGLVTAPPDEGDEAEITRTGQVLGTLSYIAPEQLRGEDASHRADVYGLGATLYRLLTGRPPYGTSGSCWEREEAIRTRQLKPVAAFRDDVPAELDVLVLKALAADPRERLATARELATALEPFAAEADLPRLLATASFSDEDTRVPELTYGDADELPTPHAEKPGWPARGFGLLTVVVTPLVALVFWWLATGNIKRQAARQALTEARATVDRFLTRMSEEKLLDKPGLQPLRKELLEEARAWYQNVRDKYGNDPAMRTELFTIYYRLAQITSDLESPTAALPLFEQAHELARELARDQPDDPEHVRNRAKALMGMGVTLQAIGNTERSWQCAQQATQLQKRLVEAHPRNLFFVSDMAKSYLNLSAIQLTTGSVPKGIKLAQTGIETIEKQFRGTRDETLQMDLALLHLNAGLGLFDQGQRKAAFQSLGRAEQIQRRLAAQEPGMKYEGRLGELLLFKADLQYQAGDLNAAEKTFEAARDVEQKLYDGSPKVHAFQGGLAKALLGQARICSDRKQPERGVEPIRRAVVLFSEVVASAPKIDRFRNELIGALRLALQIYRAADRSQDAAAAIAQLKKLGAKIED